MNKKFEYVDDNPGAYFSMLVESLNESDDYESEVKDYNIYAIKKDGSSTLVKTIHGTIRDVEDEINSKFSYLPKLSFIKRIEVRDNNTGEKVYDESLKEDKFVSRDKMSKKDRKELDNQKRNTWGSTNPVTRVQPNKKAYDRKRDKKVVEESKKLKEDVSVTEEDDYDRFYSDEWWYIGPELSEYGSVEYPYLTKTLKDVDSNDELYLKVEVPYSDSDNDFEDYEPFIDSNFGLKWFGKGSRQFKYAVKKICDYLNSEGIEVNITEERFKRI